MRVAVLLEERCKPNSNAFAYLKKYSEMCERECIQVEGSKCKILETACPVCFTRAKHCRWGRKDHQSSRGTGHRPHSFLR